MPTMHALQDERALDTARHTGDLPALSPVDRITLRLGLALILRAQHHAERQQRAGTAHRNPAAEHASVAARDAFERRTHAGTTW